MITNFFKVERTISKEYDYFELHTGFIQNNLFKNLNSEIRNKLASNSGRKSAVCVDENYIENFSLYENLPKYNWLPIVNTIKTKILEKYPNDEINYGLIHYYHDKNSKINWHSDREALRSPIYSVSIGGTRQFCLRDKNTKEVFTFNLHDGDLFIMKPGCQERYEHCIKSLKSFNMPRISITFRKIEEVLCNYILDYSTKNIYLSDKLPNNTLVLTKLKQGINICIENGEKRINEKIYPIRKNVDKKNISLLKSNLQKAIRRNKKSIAQSTCITMIKDNMEIDLLRLKEYF